MEAKQVKQAIKNSGLSQGEFAEKMGVSRDIVNRWLNGRSPIPKSQLKLLKIILAQV